MARINLDGQSMRCVSVSGLMALIPLKKEHEHLRKQIIEISQAFPDQDRAVKFDEHPDLIKLKKAS